MTTTHANLSPSSRHRWKLCPASVQAEANYPDESGPAAIDGTHTHSLLEHCVKSALRDAHQLLGAKMFNHEGEFVVDLPRADRVNVAVNYIKSILGGEVTIKSERKVDPFYLTGRLDLSGTVDVTVETSKLWHLIDYKDGGGVVEVVENPQLLQYGVAVVSEALSQQRKLPDRFRLTIVQPKLADRGMAPVQHWEIPTTRLIEEAETLKAEAARTDDPNAPFTPGEVQCRYCKHRRNCQAKVEKVMSDFKIEGMFPASLVPAMTGSFVALDAAQQAANKNPAEMPDEQIKSILDAAPLMRQLLESVEEEALRRLKGGKTIPGLKLVNGRGSRAWSIADEEEMAAKLIKMGIPKGSVYVTKLVSPAQAEKLTWTKRDGTAVQLTPRQLERMDKEYVVKMAGKLTVAPESDSRPAVTMDASSLFKPVIREATPEEIALLSSARVILDANPVPTEGRTLHPSQEPPALPDWLSS